MPAAGGGANSLLLKRGRLKRNLSAAAAASASSSPSSASSAAGGLPASCSASASLCTRSLDRKTLLLKHRQLLQLQPSDRDWVRQQLQRGCVHVFDRHMASSYLRPVLCTLDTTAAEVAARLLQMGHKGGGGVVKVLGRGPPPAAAPAAASGQSPDAEPGTAVEPPPSSGPVGAVRCPARAPPADLPLPGGAWTRCAPRASPAPSDSSPGEPFAGGPGSPARAPRPASDTESFSLSPSAESVSDRLDPYSSGGGSSSSSEELEADPAVVLMGPSGPPHRPAQPRPPSPKTSALLLPKDPTGVDGAGVMAGEGPRDEKAVAAAAPDGPLSTPGRNRETVQKTSLPPSLYVQLHGETTRRLEADEKPLQIQNDYLFQLGFGELWRVQEEGMDSEIGCLIRFYAGKPQSTGSSERIQLSGTYNVRKGKMQLPVNRWTRRQVILCGTCLIVSSVKDSVSGKMHVLPLIGGKVEEVKKHQHCLAFSSSGPQSQTYYICFDTFTEYLRWLRQVSKRETSAMSKANAVPAVRSPVLVLLGVLQCSLHSQVASQRISSVDLSCCSLEHLPANLFYSQDLTHLNLKQNFLRQTPSLPAARGLSELQRFTKLKSLNLSNNHLGAFPSAVCSIPTLAELNVSCNALLEVPAAVGDMQNLQTFLLDGNFLQSLPAELENMHQLSYLGLSFNEFTDIPEVLEKLTAVDKLCMSGNCMESLRLQALRRMPHIKHVDLRLNILRKLITDEVDFVQHVTHLDLRDNKLGDLDAMIFNNIEVLHCERNQLVTLNICGYFLKALYASSNELVQLDVYPVPSYLSYMDVSRELNCLESVPEWVCESRKLEVLDIGHNQICELPARLFCNSSLRKLLAGHNQLARLPERLERTSVEVLDVQHNQITELPPNLLMKADSLRFLNASANKLETLPAATLSEETSSILQELYLTNNSLTDKCVPLLTGHPRLKILHMAYNRLQSFPASKMAKLEELEEIDVSGNQLKAIPTTIMSCRRMHTVIAHSNCIEVFPEVLQLPEVKNRSRVCAVPSVDMLACVDLSCNELSEITLPENLPPKLQELDLTGNPRLALDHKSLELLKLTSAASRLTSRQQEMRREPQQYGVMVTLKHRESRTKRLCVAALSVNNFRDNREALYGVFDGDRNVEVPYLLQCTMSDILAEEIQKTKNEEEYMANTFIVMQRKLGTAGQKLGGAAVLCHIKHDPVDPGGSFTLTSANVGKCQTVLCRSGRPLSLSRSYVMSCEEERKRIKQHKAIITESPHASWATPSSTPAWCPPPCAVGAF
ncbi:PH domain leucine-rich repeat-containing protein phosphatase 1 [Apodemus speciosus]|uniref:PH domain leucine-rich repeat-containing protein phosphatase 1 n=1 Tax=Apodemus speciosus TaxID=105296 RepID=A0ABQ0EE78_APOSI